MYPFRPGYSMVGRVIAIGKGATGVKEGDRIASYGSTQQYYKEVPLYDVRSVTTCRKASGCTSSRSDQQRGEESRRSLAVTTQNALRRAQFQFGEKRLAWSVWASSANW
jgi:hypothetical protein